MPTSALSDVAFNGLHNIKHTHTIFLCLGILSFVAAAAACFIISNKPRSKAVAAFIHLVFLIVQSQTKVKISNDMVGTRLK